MYPSREGVAATDNSRRDRNRVILRMFYPRDWLTWRRITWH
ncbi:unnamed protein product [Brassica rapa subsp. trilocularis]